MRGQESRSPVSGFPVRQKECFFMGLEADQYQLWPISCH